MSSPTPQPPAWRKFAAPLLLGAVLAQVLMFFFGLTVPLNRILLLWNKTREERLKIIWQPGSVLTDIASRIPPSAHVFMVQPDSFLHKQSMYYLYPRRASVTVTNTGYTEEMYVQWNEPPTVPWLLENNFTHVIRLNRQRGFNIWEVTPDMVGMPWATQDSNAK